MKFRVCTFQKNLIVCLSGVGNLGQYTGNNRSRKEVDGWGGGGAAGPCLPYTCEAVNRQRWLARRTYNPMFASSRLTARARYEPGQCPTMLTVKRSVMCSTRG